MALISYFGFGVLTQVLSNPQMLQQVRADPDRFWYCAVLISDGGICILFLRSWQ
jgi:hypothetical protein